MEDAGDGARDRHEGVGEVLLGEHHAEAGVLHPDLDRDCPRRHLAPQGEPAREVAEEEAEGVEADDREHEPEAGLDDALAPAADDRADDEADGDDGHEGRGRQHAVDGAGEAPLEQRPRRHRHDDDLHGAEQQPGRGDVDAAAGEQGGQRRRHQDRQRRGQRRQRHRERHVGPRQVRDDVRGGAPGAARDEHEAHRERCRQGEEIPEAPAEGRHDRVLQDHPRQHPGALAPDAAEVVEAQGHAHAEHDDAEADGDEGSAEPREPVGPDERRNARAEHPQGKRRGQPGEDAGHGQIPVRYGRPATTAWSSS